MAVLGGGPPAGFGTTLYVRAILFDSGAFIALASAADGHHKAALDCLDEIARLRLPTFVVGATMHETHRHILHRHGRAHARQFVASVLDGFVNVIRATAEDDDRAVALLDEYGHIDLTLTDTLNVAVMLRIGIGTIFSFDDHFLRIGVLRAPPLPA